jgi:signal transduction histidine kinase
LRTPLTSVAGYLELMLEDEDLIDDQVVEYLRIARRNAARLERLVDDLLFFAQFDAGRFSIVPGPVALDEVVADALRSARPRAGAKALTLTSDTTELPEGLVGDRLRLGQVLDNLVSNAVKFTPDGGEISVTTRVDGDSVTIAVADTGIGVPADEQGQLFQRFFRSSAATERAIQGTGLGLAITKTIVEAHGGTMEFVSKPDVGTTVSVTLPLAVEPARKLVAVHAA